MGNSKNVSGFDKKKKTLDNKAKGYKKVGEKNTNLGRRVRGRSLGAQPVVHAK